MNEKQNMFSTSINYQLNVLNKYVDAGDNWGSQVTQKGVQLLLIYVNLYVIILRFNEVVSNLPTPPLLSSYSKLTSKLT
jgi:hypothetical protein